MTDAEGVSEATKAAFREAGYDVRDVPRLGARVEATEGRLSVADNWMVYSKLHAWTLTEYCRVVFLDGDMVAVGGTKRAFDDLFNLDRPVGACVVDAFNRNKEPAPGMCEHDAGVLSLVPDARVFERMRQELFVATTETATAGWRCGRRMNEQSYLSHVLGGCYDNQHTSKALEQFCLGGDYACDKIARRTGPTQPYTTQRLIHYCGEKPWAVGLKVDDGWTSAYRRARDAMWRDVGTLSERGGTELLGSDDNTFE
jgi:hypothetical protein